MTDSLILFPYRLVSTSGYVVVDDTGHPQFDTSMDWPWVVNQSLPAASSASCSAVDVSKVTDSVNISILLLISIFSVDTVVCPVLLSLTVLGRYVALLYNV